MTTEVVNLDEYKKLSEAARIGRVDVLTNLISQGLDPNRVLKRGYHPPVYWACRYGHLQIVRVLIEQHRCSPKYVTDRGTSLLHVACTMGYLDIARYLAKEHHLDPNDRNQQGVTMLYSACYNGHLPIMKFLLGEMHCDLKIACVTRSIPNGSEEHAACASPISDSDSESADEEESLLVTACSRGYLDIVMYLIHEQGFDPHTLSKFDETLLHVACSNGHLEVARYLVEKQHCSVDCTDTSGCTPLHAACENGGPEASQVAQFLVTQDACDPNAQDNCGNTPLHVACCYGRLEVVMVLLATERVDPSCTTVDGKAPIEIARSKEIINELIRGGANTENLKLEHLQVEDHLKSLVRIFVVGHPSSGKTTLVQALHPEQCKPRKRVIKRYRKVPRVHSHTAGIIPYEFESDEFGRVLMFDFAGQCEYYASHAALLECSNTSSAPLFMLVVNLTETDSTIQQRIRYWLSFVESHRVSTSSPPDIIIVGSHKDVLKKQSPSEYRGKISAIESFAKNQVSTFTTLHMIGFFVIDCRKPGKQTKLRHGLQQSCSRLRANVKVDSLCHYLSLLILEKFQNRIWCTIEEIIKELSASRLPVPLRADRLAELCMALSDRMSILFLNNPLELKKSWVVLNIETLLSTINGRLFAPRYFKEHCIEASSTGVLSSTHLQENFHDLDPSLVMAFLSRLEFCHEVSDDETLQLIRDGISSGGKKKGVTASISSSTVSVSSTTPLIPRDDGERDVVESDGVERERTAAERGGGGRRQGERQTPSENSLPSSLPMQSRSGIPHYGPPIVLSPPQDPVTVNGQFAEGNSPPVFFPDPIATNMPGLVHPMPTLPAVPHGMMRSHTYQPPPQQYYQIPARPSHGDGQYDGYPHYQSGYHHHHPGNTPKTTLFRSEFTHPRPHPGRLAESYTAPSPNDHDHHVHPHDRDRMLRSHPSTSPLPTYPAAIVTAFPKDPKKYLFFPALISSDCPKTGIWVADDSFQFYTGWCLSCSKENQFFTPRFLQILLLRLAFGFAAAKVSSSGAEEGGGNRIHRSNIFDRECTVWRNGLRWLDLDGIETVVEMIEESRHVVVTMRGQKGSELKCIRLRSAVIRKILEAKQQFCANVFIDEYLIEPSTLRRTYPVVHTVNELTLFDKSVIVRAITEKSNFVYCSRGVKMLNLGALLYFDSYTGLGEELLSQVYQESSQQKSEDVQSFFYEFSWVNCNRVAELSQILGVDRSPNPSPRSSLNIPHFRTCTQCSHTPSPPPPENRCMEVSVLAIST